MKPWEKEERPDMNAIIPMAYRSCFSNRHGEEWVAYIDFESYVVRVSGDDVGWEWKTVKVGEHNAPWVMDAAECTWLAAVLESAREVFEMKKIVLEAHAKRNNTRDISKH